MTQPNHPVPGLRFFPWLGKPMNYEEKRLVRLEVTLRLAGIPAGPREILKPQIIRDAIHRIKIERGKP